MRLKKLIYEIQKKKKSPQSHAKTYNNKYPLGTCSAVEHDIATHSRVCEKTTAFGLEYSRRGIWAI